MFKTIASISFLLLGACAVAQTRDTTASTSSALFGGGTCQCGYMGVSNEGSGSSSGGQTDEGCFCATLSPSLTLSPGQTTGALEFFLSGTLPTNQPPTFSISALPSGVTAVEYPLAPDAPGEPWGVSYDFTVLKTASLEPGKAVTVTATAVDAYGKPMIATATYSIAVEGTCFPTTCNANVCNHPTDGCSNTLNCGTTCTDPTDTCNLTTNFCVPKAIGFTCPKGTHSCGDGSCAIHCS